MTGLYITLCWIAAVTCVIAGIGGGLAFRSGFAHPRAWAGIRVAQATVVAAAAIGTVLFAGAGEPGHGLQYGYSLMAAAVSFAAEQLRLASASSVLGQRGLDGVEQVAELPAADQEQLARQIALRELGVEAVALFVCAALLLRGAGAY
ncbi:MAG: hypothetical protein WCL20_02205 [Actinomycetes bacterium]